MFCLLCKCTVSCEFAAKKQQLFLVNVQVAAAAVLVNVQVAEAAVSCECTGGSNSCFMGMYRWQQQLFLVNVQVAAAVVSC